MESPEEFTGSNDHSSIIKGKRTKRQRPSSPHGAAVTTSTSSTGGGDGGSGGGSGASGVGGGGDVCSSIPSPTTSSEILSISTEEDEDLANCLILLAQGLVRPRQLVPKNEEEEENKNGKFKTTIGKSEFYVYECKTCNRTFPSFQALGGHRASHKKTKNTIHGEEKRVLFVEEEEEVEKINKISSLPPPPLQTVISPNTKTPHLNKSKVHECSICGSEFSSGQALGGHMRRHRAPPNTRIPMTVDSSSIVESEEELGSSNKRRNILSLDLNLPAPPEDDHHHHHHHQRDSKFEFTPNKQHLVFSAPALVDCHY